MRPVLLCALILLGTARPAAAHQSSVVYSDIRVEGAAVDYLLTIASGDLYEAVGGARPESVSRQAVTSRALEVQRYLLGRVRVQADGKDCPGQAHALELVDKAGGFAVRAPLRYLCGVSDADLAVTYDLFFDLDPRHQGFARVRLGNGEPSQHVFRHDARRLSLRRDVSLLATALDYLRLGMEHIFTGADHIAFVVGLLLLAPLAAGGRTRRGVLYTVKVATAFTLAHSVTLALAALGILTLPSSVVEPGIAATIAFVGAEDLLGKLPRRRYVITFLFGLVHGLGFASVLAEIGLPRRGFALALGMFNLGVEIGQVCIVLLVVPPLMLIARRSERAYRVLLRVAGAGLFLAGVTWFVLRLL